MLIFIKKKVKLTIYRKISTPVTMGVKFYRAEY